MRCVACQKNLNDYESTRKSETTGEYIDLCNHCYIFVKEDVNAIEREDLNSCEEIDEGDYLYLEDEF